MITLNKQTRITRSAERKRIDNDYPWDRLELRWYFDAQGETADMMAHTRRINESHEFLFKCRKVDGGYRVWRVR